MLILQNALRCATANCAVLVLAGCGFAFLPQLGFAQTSSVAAPSAPSVLTCSGNDGTASYKVGPGACADGESAIAIGQAVIVPSDQSTGLGIGAQVHSTNGTAVGPAAHIGTGAESALAIGANAEVQNGHAGSVAIGFRARTSAANRIDFGAVSHVYRNRFNTGNLRATLTTSYRFAGLSLAETGIGEADLMAGETFTAQQNLTSAQLNALTGAEINARWRIIDRYRSGAASRALVVDGHGVMRAVDADLGVIATNAAAIGGSDDAASASGSLYARIRNNADHIGTASQDASGSGTLYQRIASLRANSYDDTEVRGLIGSNRDAIAKASQGVALSNALSAIPNTLDPGKKLRLGIGVGSFDGKSATAIGVTGKFGASTLNAGFSSGGGETSTRMGISWQW